MGLIDSAKDAAKLVQQIGNIELYEKLVSVEQDAMSLIDENRNLKDPRCGRAVAERMKQVNQARPRRHCLPHWRAFTALESL